MELNNLPDSAMYFYNETDCEDYIKISPYNPHTTSAIIIDDFNYPDIDYKNYTRVYINKKTYLENKEFYKAYRLQILASIIMCLIIINTLYSLWYFNNALLSIIPIESLIFSLPGILSVKNFDKKKIFLYLIYIIFNIIVKVSVFLYIDIIYSNFIISFVQLFVDINIFIILYYFYSYLF